MTKAFIRYHGGKYMSAEWIISHFPPHRVYVEPFGGGASVLLRKARSYAEIYSDLDSEIVNLFRVARDRPADLVRVLELTPFAREELDVAYQDAADELEQARRTVIRCFMGQGSNSMKLTRDGRRERMGFRADSNKSGSTPAADWRCYPSGLGTVLERLRGVVIEQRPAIQVMERHDGPDTLHYVDPPYLPSVRGKGHDYRHEMTEEEHVALAQFLRQRQGYVAVSGYPSDLYDALFAGWRRVEKKAYADGGNARTEVLWLSPNVPQYTLL